MTRPQVLFVLTSLDKLEDSGKNVGWYLVSIPCFTTAAPAQLIDIQPEFAHPYYVLSPHSDITVASPKGGKAPLDPSSVEYFKDDPECAAFLNDKTHLWNTTEKLSDLVEKAKEFDVVYFVGGHGRACLFFLLLHDQGPPPIR